MKNKNNLPGFLTDLKCSVKQENYFETINFQMEKNDAIVMQRLRLPSIFGGVTLLSVNGDDCYNRVTRACNNAHPGKNYSDPIYKKCIDRGLDGCDRNEPA